MDNRGGGFEWLLGVVRLKRGILEKLK